ncbi:hypothetical protein EIP91_010404, partial [Steccherinum ochraceum]
TIAVFTATLAATFLQYAQSLFATNAVRSFDDATNVLLYTSIILAVGCIPLAAGLTGTKLAAIDGGTGDGNHLR